MKFVVVTLDDEGRVTEIASVKSDYKRIPLHESDYWKDDMSPRDMIYFAQSVMNRVIDRILLQKEVGSI